MSDHEVAINMLRGQLELTGDRLQGVEAKIEFLGVELSAAEKRRADLSDEVVSIMTTIATLEALG